MTNFRFLFFKLRNLCSRLLTELHHIWGHLWADSGPAAENFVQICSDSVQICSGKEILTPVFIFVFNGLSIWFSP